MRSAASGGDKHDPFASTSNALSRAKERRNRASGTAAGDGGATPPTEKQRKSRAVGHQESPGSGAGAGDEPDEDLKRSRSAKKSSSSKVSDDGTEPAAIPTRATGKSRTKGAKEKESKEKSSSNKPSSRRTPQPNDAGEYDDDEMNRRTSSSSRKASSKTSGRNDSVNASVAEATTPKAPAAATMADGPVTPSVSNKKSKNYDDATHYYDTAPVQGPKALDTLPSSFRDNPQQADPVLFYLPRLLSSTEEEQKTSLGDKEAYLLDLNMLLQAAQDDVRLHRGRVQASLRNDMRLIRTYTLEKDPEYQDRQERISSRKSMIRTLTGNAKDIMDLLKGGANDADKAKGKTVAEMAELHLQQWQRALEVYVHCPPEELPNNSNLDWSVLFDLLLAGIPEDQDISQILSQASEMCRTLSDATRLAVHDAARNVSDLEAMYRIRLQAHTEFARHSLGIVGQVEDQFKRSGRAALQIGQQLEHAELKRSQCEAASVLIRRWWTLETLAEQEAATDEAVPVMDEVCGRLEDGEEYQMDELYTKPENSLEAARALKQLRAVVRSKGNAAATGSTSAAMLHDKAAQRRFDLTARLIERTSAALEHRLLAAFETVYIEGGGAYDFSAKPRPGSMDWRELRSLAQALLLFDSGRNLHKRYVDMVVTSRFPELFQKTIQEQSAQRQQTGDFDMDSTRSKLSNLFHRVSDVCTAEFELIAYVFGSNSIINPHEGADNSGREKSRTDWNDGSEEMALVVARALLQRVISDPHNGLQARINDLLASIDRIGDFDAGAKKLDTFVVIHEKAAGLFSLLKEAAERMIPGHDSTKDGTILSPAQLAARNAVESLKGFLTSQELALSNTHRQGYINLELRLLHHDCCSSLDLAGCTLVKAPPRRPDKSLIEKGILEEYKAPVLPLHKMSLAKSGYTGILAGPLKQSVLRQPLIHATDSLARARLMFGTSKRGGETTARVILSIYNQMCNFYGQGFLYPIVETIKEMLPSNPPAQVPPLPFDEEQEAPDLGVSPAFWVALERIHSASKSFDRELWAEGREGSHRVWEILTLCGDESSIEVARSFRVTFYTELERRGEAAILRALDVLSTHVQWVLVAGGENMMITGGARIFNQLTGQSGGPYSIPAGSSLDTPNSPAIKSLTYCLRVQFVHVQAALTPQSLASFWTALSMRLYDILVARLLQHYTVSTVGAVILSRDIESLRSVSMLAGTDHSHWDSLREVVTLYMTPPDAIKTMLLGPDGDATKGLFHKAGREHALAFLSRRNDYRYKTAAGSKKSQWVTDMLLELNMSDPSDGVINIGSFAAANLKK